MEPEVLTVTRTALRSFESLGMEVTTLDALPSFGSFTGNADLWPTWLIFRHWLIGGILKPLYDNPTFRAAMKPEAIYEIEGLLSGADGNAAISGLDTYNGSVKRTGLYQAFRTLFETYDYAVLPTAQVFPFDADGALAEEHQRRRHVVVPSLDGGHRRRHLAERSDAGRARRLQRRRPADRACR